MTRRRAEATGGPGFPGSHLCERILDEGYEIICLDDSSTGDAGNVEHRALSWEPIVDVQDGLVRTIDSFRQQADLGQLTGAGIQHS